MNAIAVIKDAPGQDVAKLWASWWCSLEGQTAIAQKSQIYPILPGAPPPPGWPKLEEINPQRRTADQTENAKRYGEIFDELFFK
jgi:ABC-type Fe3+ transport system substrate-binding protein